MDRLHLCEERRELAQGLIPASTWPKHHFIYELQLCEHHGGGRNGTVGCVKEETPWGTGD